MFMIVKINTSTPNFLLSCGMVFGHSLKVTKDFLLVMDVTYINYSYILNTQ